MATENTINELKLRLDKVASFDPNSLPAVVRHDDVRDGVAWSVAACRRLRNCRLSDLPEPLATVLTRSARDLDLAVSPLMNSTTESRIEDDVVRLRTAIAAHYEPLVIANSFASPDANDAIESVKRDAAATAALLEKSQGIVKNIEDAAAKTAVATHAKIFGEQANDDKATATIWQRITLGAGVGTFAATAWLFYEYLTLHEKAIGDGGEYHFPFAATAAGVAIVSVFYYALVFCARTYRAYLHCEVVNRHRHNALRTFQAFSDSAGDDQVARSALLNQAAQAIFQPQATGFSPGKESDSAGPQQIVEVARGVLGKSG